MKIGQIKVDESLIVSRIQRKELFQIKPIMVSGVQAFPLVTQEKIEPFIGNLPIKIGLDINLLGNKVLGAQVVRGFFHHGVEKSLGHMTCKDALRAIGRIEPHAPIFYQIALVAAYAEIYGWDIEPIEKKRWAIAMELMRITHHLDVILNTFKCLKLFSLVEQTRAMVKLMTRPCTTFCRIFFEPQPKISALLNHQLYQILNEAHVLLEELNQDARSTKKMMTILAGKAVVPLGLAGSMGLSGNYLRANNNAHDLRHRIQGLSIYDAPPRICLAEGGDLLSRFLLRISEIDASISWLKNTLNNSHKDLLKIPPITFEDGFIQKQAIKRYAFFEMEGPEGDIKVSIFRSEPDHQLVFWIRTPAYFIAQAIPHFLSQIELDDLAILFFSLGICAEEVDK